MKLNEHPASADPMQYCFDRAVQFRSVTKLDHVDFAKSISVLCECYGTEWLRAESLRTIRDEPGARIHPVALMLTVAHGMDVVHLVELALYLRTLREIPGFDAVRDKNLRAAHCFATTLQQLAFAYRFRLAGATDLTLEPALASGQAADIAFNLQDQKLVVESYCPSLSLGIRPTAILLRDRARGVLAEIPPGRQVHATLKLKIAIDSRTAKYIEAMLHRALTGFLEGGPSTLDNGIACVDLREISPFEAFNVRDTQRPDGTAPVFRVVRGLVSDVGASTLVNSPFPIDQVGVVERASAMDVFDAPDDGERMTIEEVARRLADKISRKISQLSGESANRFLVVNVPVEDLASPLLRLTADELQKRVIPIRERLAGIYLVRRTWRPERWRSVYDGLFIQGRDRGPMRELMGNALYRLWNIEQNDEVSRDF